MRPRTGGVTLLLVDAQHDDDLVAADADELLDAADAPPRQLGEEDHAVDVVVLEELDVGAHLGDLTVSLAARGRKTHLHDLDHDEALQLGVLLLVEAAVC
jgi:hypothetical protein